MSASARPSARKSACNGPTATRAHPTGYSPTSSSSLTGRSRRPPTGIRPDRRVGPDGPHAAFGGEEGPASARHDLVHLHDRFDLRVVGNVAHDLRAVLGKRLLKFVSGVELKIGDGEIGRL